VAQDVLAANLVVEHIEAEGRLRLRLTIQLSLKAPDPSPTLGDFERRGIPESVFQ